MAVKLRYVQTLGSSLTATQIAVKLWHLQAFDAFLTATQMAIKLWRVQTFWLFPYCCTNSVKTVTCTHILTLFTTAQMAVKLWHVQTFQHFTAAQMAFRTKWHVQTFQHSLNVQIATHTMACTDIPTLSLLPDKLQSNYGMHWHSDSLFTAKQMAGKLWHALTFWLFLYCQINGSQTMACTDILTPSLLPDKWQSNYGMHWHSDSFLTARLLWYLLWQRNSIWNVRIHVL